MKLKGYIRYILMSPFFVYIYTLLFFGIMSLTPYSDMVSKLAAYGDIFALLMSLVVSNHYARSVRTRRPAIAIFAYNTFYMIGMVFNLTYENPLTCVILSGILPLCVSIYVYKKLTSLILRLDIDEMTFQTTMMTMPILCELLLIARFTLIIATNTGMVFRGYDTAISIYTSMFGFIILFILLVSVKMTISDMDRITTIMRQNKQIQDDFEKVERLSMDMLTALVGTIEAKDYYTSGHSIRVAKYSKMIAEEMEMPPEEVDAIHKMAIMHDIGKIGIQDDIITKPGKLASEEYELVKQHPAKGADILEGIEDMPRLFLGAKYHHERWDGQGYPFGIAGEEIPLEARIISVADAYDAMTSVRSYRTALDQDVVVDEIRKGIGTQFNPEVAYAMLNIISRDKDYTLKQ